jgi:hypothetical protein
MWKCMECGRKFRTAKAVERAANNGCPKCGGVDVDLDVDSGSEAPRSGMPVPDPRSPVPEEGAITDPTEPPTPFGPGSDRL